jgi:hypothetical protein
MSGWLFLILLLTDEYMNSKIIQKMRQEFKDFAKENKIKPTYKNYFIWKNGFDDGFYRGQKHQIYNRPV